MNKRFMYVGDSIVVSDENGMKAPIPYVDNIEDVLILENEIEYLKKCLEEDSSKIEHKSKERLMRSKECKKISLVGSVLAVGVGFGVSEITGYSHMEVVNNAFGQMSEYLSMSIALSTSGIVFSNVISLLGLSFMPSKKEINGYKEKVEYEKEMIDVLGKELEYLKEHLTVKNKDKVTKMLPYTVHYQGSIEYLMSALKLRYAYGYNYKSIMELYENGELADALIKEGFADDVIMDFITFIERRKEIEKQEVELLKK